MTIQPIRPRATGPTMTPGERAKQLQAEANRLVGDHITELSAALSEVERLAAEVASGGDMYHPGVREIARRLIDEVSARRQGIQAVLSKVPQ